VPSPILASSFFFLLVTPGLAQDLSARLSRISGPVRHAGTYHVATGTWTRGVPLAALTGPDTIFDNTCRASYFAPQASGEKWQTRQVLPSPTRPYSPCTPPHQQAPGCQTSYEINGFEIAYCSSHPSTVDWLVEFADLFTFCATADMIPTRSFPLPGLPGGTPGGALNCWVVDVDLSATTPSFVLQADGDGSYGGGDTFGLSFGPTNAVANGTTGMFLAGKPSVCTGVDGTIWDHPVDLTEEGSGMGALSVFRVTGTPPSMMTPPGCYTFGPEPLGMYLELYADAQCAVAPPITSFCFPGQGGVIACPCGNPPGASGRGCENSAGTGGAVLSAYGIPSLAADTLHLHVEGEKPTALSIFLQGPLTIAPGTPFGQGVRCVGGALRRLYTRNASGGVVDAGGCGGDPTVSARSAALGDPISAGQVRGYATYYRDPIVLGGCPATSTFNTTQSISVSWVP